MGNDYSRGVSRATTSGGKYAERLTWALSLTVTYMAAEVIGGLLTRSLALLADATHMMTDAAGLGLALVAIRFAAREATPQKTFGYLRAEILAALANATVLLVVTVFILYEAYRRLMNPPEIIGGPMLLVAAIGLVVNLISMRILASGTSESLNVKGAYFEVLSDMLGSIGVIAAALIVMWTGWRPIDPIIGAGIGLFIIPRTWKLLSETVNILLEGTPSGINYNEVMAALQAVPGVGAVHDLHLWSITSGVNALSVHLEVPNYVVPSAVLNEARAMLKETFHIEHITIQVESEMDCDSDESAVPHMPETRTKPS